MKLIEADKVEQAIKDYWKAQVDRLPIPKNIEEHDERVNRLDAILEHNDGLLKAIDELPSAELDTTTHDSIPAKTGENDGDRTSDDCISRRRSVDTLRKMQTYKLFAGDDMLLIDQAEAQTELMMMPSAQPEIIRCKDCKHSRFFDPCFYCYEMGGEIIVPENGFCFKAERREDG